jgi:meckelin
MFAIRMLNVFYLIWRQSNINICFIDWERTEIFRPKEIEEEIESMEKNKPQFKSKQSVWRTLLIANEFNELQTLRTISIDWTMLIFGVFMVYAFWRHS